MTAETPTVDLDAIRAQHVLITRAGGGYCASCGSDGPEWPCDADALLGMVDTLTALAADALAVLDGAQDSRLSSDEVRTAVNHAARELRAALGVPRSAGHEEDPVRTATPGTWRVGRSLGRTIYRDDQLVGLLDTVELAEAVVAAMNVSVGGAPTTEPGRSWIGVLGDAVEQARADRKAEPDALDIGMRSAVGEGQPYRDSTRDPDTTGGGA